MCQVNQSKDVVCPTCGICPTCGRRTWDYSQYYYPFYRPDPTWPSYTAWASSNSICEEGK